MTWGDLVRKFFPNATDAICEFILWEKTAYPLVSAEEVEKQLQEYQMLWLAEKRSNYVGEEDIYC
jgi:hypothetical protein